MHASVTQLWVWVALFSALRSHLVPSLFLSHSLLLGGRCGAGQKEKRKRDRHPGRYNYRVRLFLEQSFTSWEKELINQTYPARKPNSEKKRRKKPLRNSMSLESVKDRLIEQDDGGMLVVWEVNGLVLYMLSRGWISVASLSVVSGWKIRDGNSHNSFCLFHSSIVFPPPLTLSPLLSTPFLYQPQPTSRQ